MVQAVMDGKMTPDVLQQMLDVQKDYEKNEAEKAFHRALAEFKTNEIRLEKDKLVSFDTQKGRTEYRHTTLGAALSVINPILSQYGLSLSWETKQETQSGGEITVTCVLSHSMGASKETALSAAPDASGGKNSIQAIASTVSYLERYTAFALVGLASMDQDDDGNGAGQPKPEVEYITAEQSTELHALINENGLDLKMFLKVLATKGVDSLETIPADGFTVAKDRIEKAIAGKAA